MMFDEGRITWRRRIYRGALVLVVNVLFWIVIPWFLYGAFSSLLVSPSTLPYISLASIYAFGAIITGLQVIRALTEGMGISVFFETGSYIAIAYYIYFVLNAGVISLSASGFGITLSFQPLLYLLILPALFGAVRAPLSYLSQEHEAARPSPDFV